MWKLIFDAIIKALPYVALIFIGLVILGIIANVISYAMMFITSVCQIVWTIVKVSWYTHTIFIVAAFVAWLAIFKVNLTEITGAVFTTPGFVICAFLGIAATIIKLLAAYSDLYFAIWLRAKKEQIEIEKYDLSDIVPEEVKINYYKHGIIMK